MTGGFTKLFSSIVTSTIWQEPNDTRIVWITLLALADAQGRVEGSVPGLAHIAHVDLAACEEALERLMAPDPYSRTKDFEGRRIAAIDGGWLVLNYAKYRERRDPEKRREQTREAVRRHRERNACKPPVSQCKPRKAQAEAEADTEEEKNPPLSPQGGKAPAKVSFGEFVKLTEDEHAKLIAQFGIEGTAERIARLNEYIGSTGKRYRSHYYTILSWARKDDVANRRPVDGDHRCAKGHIGACSGPGVHKHAGEYGDYWLCEAHEPKKAVLAAGGVR